MSNGNYKIKGALVEKLPLGCTVVYNTLSVTPNWLSAREA